jgi:hypothetical protein
LNRQKMQMMKKASNLIFAFHSQRKAYGLSVVLLFATFVTAHAQLRLIQLPRTDQAKTKTTARTQDDPLTLPFFDDFSSTPVLDGNSITGGTVLESHWELPASLSVYVNPGNGINPPSINVATLDGLNRVGLKYSEQQLNNGFADTLVSQPIDLSLLAVTLPERDFVYLSFFYQRGGNAEIPDRQDYLRLEFKKADGEWVEKMTYTPEQAPDNTLFYPATVQVVDAAFFHETFQFRFRNYGRLSGPFDAWNVDHIFLDKNRGDNFDLNDVTFTRSISPLFGKYRSMPLEHFRDSSLLTKLETEVFSLWPNDSLPTSGYDVVAWFHNTMGDESVLTDSSHFANGRGVRPLTSQTSRLVQFERLTVTLDRLPDTLDVGQFNPAAHIDIDFEFSLNIKDSLGNFQPDYFKTNDTINVSYHLDDYYAYDDGSAEYAAVLTNPGVRVAYAFDLVRKSDEPEFINNFEIYFPKWGIVQNLAPTFYVYDDNDGEPGEILWGGSVVISSLEQNQFQTVLMNDNVQVNKRFYIGWEAPVGGLIPVGLDYNNDTGDKILYRANGVWNVNDAIAGSLMIRPHMGEGVFTGVSEEDEKAVRAYPNPSRGVFYIQDDVSVVDAISITGQHVPVSSIREDGQTKIIIDEPSNGMYILRTSKGNRIHTQKIVVSDTF